MWFGIGITELALFALVFFATAMIAVFRRRAWPWLVAANGCTLTGMLLTPADPVSMLILASVLFLIFFSGNWISRHRMFLSSNEQG